MCTHTSKHQKNHIVNAYRLLSLFSFSISFFRINFTDINVVDTIYTCRPFFLSTKPRKNARAYQQLIIIRFDDDREKIGWQQLFPFPAGVDYRRCDIDFQRDSRYTTTLSCPELAARIRDSILHEDIGG